MTVLYALPDHEVVANLLPVAAQKQLSVCEATPMIRDTPGLVPVAIDHRDGGRVYWANIGNHAYREWQFLFTIERLAKEEAIRDAFSTPMDILLLDDLIPDTIPPAGLIFHVSRCGSTLLGKALARHPEQLVINQGGPLQRGFWAWLTDDWCQPMRQDEEAIRAFRNLVFAMTRRRDPAHVRSFIKFISWNILCEDFIREAFPDLPALFLYRDPVEVIASVMKETTAALVAKPWREAGFLTGLPFTEANAMGDVAYLAHCYANYFRTGLDAGKPGLRSLNYRRIGPDSFSDILTRGLRLAPDESGLATMQEQFSFH